MIDIPNRTIRLDVEQDELFRRRTAMEAAGVDAWRPANRRREVSAALRAYALLTTSAGFLLVEVLVALFLASLIFLVLAALISFAVFTAKTSDNLTGATALAATKVEELRSTDYDLLVAGGSTATDVAGFFDDADVNADGFNDFYRRWEIIDQGTTKLITVFVSSELEMVGMPKDAAMTLVVAEK